VNGKDGRKTRIGLAVQFRWNRKKSGYPKIFASDIGSGYPKISQEPSTLDRKDGGNKHRELGRELLKTRTMLIFHEFQEW